MNYKSLIVIGLFLFPLSVLAQLDCPFGFENDPAPGSCARYIDTDSNGLCDLSELPLEPNVFSEAGPHTKLAYISEEELKRQTVGEMALIYNIDQNEFAAALAKYLGKGVLTTDPLQVLHDQEGLCLGVVAEIALSIQVKNSGNIIDEDSADNAEVEALKKKQALPHYKIINIVLTLILLYLASSLLVKNKKITLYAQRRFWNLVLLLSFAATLILGLLLIIRINWGWSPALPFNMLYWHVETGAVMAVVSVLHILWHWQYYACMFKRKKTEECEK